MDNLISRWRQTVENHNKKLHNMRDQSLGASSNGQEAAKSETQNAHGPSGGALSRARSQNRHLAGGRSPEAKA